MVLGRPEKAETFLGDFQIAGTVFRRMYYRRLLLVAVLILSLCASEGFPDESPKTGFEL